MDIQAELDELARLGRESDAVLKRMFDKIDPTGRYRAEAEAAHNPRTASGRNTQMAGKNQIKITPDLIQSFEACQFDGNELHMPDPTVKRFDNWPAMKKVFDALGGKWNRKAGAVVFPSDARALLLPAVEAGGVTDTKKLYQFFPTPAPVAAKLIQEAKIGAIPMPHVPRVLEPSAGDGGIVKVLLKAYPNVHVDCVEIQASQIERLKGIFSHYPETTWTAKTGDFLKMPASPVYDRVIMNPPFADDQDVKHVTHAWGFVKPGGRLVAVMSGGVMDKDHAVPRAFRALWLSVNGRVINLGYDQFKESGTSVSTVIVVMDKPAAPVAKRSLADKLAAKRKG